MPAGFEVDPNGLDGMADRFRQASHDLNDLPSLASSAAGVDLRGTPSGAAFAHAWEQFAGAYERLAKSAIAIGAKLNENARKYREAESSTTARLDSPRHDRNRNLE